MRRRETFTVAALAAFAWLLLFHPSAAVAQENTNLSVDLGWADRLRAGRWNPITVRVSNPKHQQAVLEVYAPQGGSYSMLVRQYFTLGPQTTTLQVYAPLRNYGADEAAVIVRSAETGKALARFPRPTEFRDFYRSFLNAPNSRLVGVAGARSAFESVRGQLKEVDLQIGNVDLYLLPRSPIGYDSLDLLVLNRANLLNLDDDQQKAIVDWVRAGGNLLLWPGDDPAPEKGPLIDVLPARIEGPLDLRFSQETRDELGLSADLNLGGLRGSKLAANATAGADAEAFTLFPGTVGGTGYRRRLGLGRIVVAPTDLTQLPFIPTYFTRGRQFWGKVLQGTGVLPGEETADRAAQRSGYYDLDPEISNQAAATTMLMDFLGNVPGAGRFGFAYVAYVLLGMMAVVGPVDWFVLKKLGRQPWTWVTTAGWIGLITVGAVYAGHLFKSGDLHYRTVQVVDQVGDQTVGEVSLTCVYSPKTATYHLDGPKVSAAADAAGQPADAPAEPPAGWWAPAVGAGMYSSRGLKNEMPFRQNNDGNYPGPMLINVWNLRFVRGEQVRRGDPIIEAVLSLETNPPRVVGTVKNLGTEPLTNVRVRTSGGVTTQAVGTGSGEVLLDRLEPGASAAVSGKANAGPEKKRSILYNPGDRPRHNVGGDPIPEAAVWLYGSELSGPRSARIDRLVSSGGFAVVYAEVPDPKPPAALREEGAKQKHYKIIRALVPLKGAAGAAAQ